MIKTIFATILAMSSLTACASGSYDLDFEAQDKYDDVRIAWYVVKDVPQTCAMAGVLRGAKVQYNQKIVACAVLFRASNSCVIYTAKKLSLAVLGHEVRHCFEGAWHP
jgi:hypothetical protein